MAGVIIKETGKAATRVGYGDALKELGAEYPNLVVLDADLAASTMTAVFGKEYPEFLIAERTRSFASETALSGKPTILMPGRELRVSTSTSTL